MITIIERPDTISDIQLCNLIHDAHQVNYDKGLIYGTSKITELEIRNKFERQGTICFVAMDENDLVGMECVSIIDVKKWYHKGKAAYFELIAIKPGNQGKGIATMLRDRCIEYAKDKGLSFCLSISAEKNEAIRRIYENCDFKKVGYGAGKTNNFYSIFYAKWLKDCPYADLYIRMRFWLDKLAHRVVFKEGGKLRLR